MDERRHWATKIQKFKIFLVFWILFLRFLENIVFAQAEYVLKKFVS